MGAFHFPGKSTQFREKEGSNPTVDPSSAITV